MRAAVGVWFALWGEPNSISSPDSSGQQQMSRVKDEQVDKQL